MEIKLISSTDNAEKHIEYCARISYNSIDKITDTSHAKFLPILLKNGHLSVFEHSTATFFIDGISRATSHQLVRHRIASYTQKSQRYISEVYFRITTPPDIEANPEAKAIYNETIYTIREAYTKLSELGIRKEDARFLLPNATHTTITMTANFREWLTVIDLRASKHAQWEIREMAILIWKKLYKIAPAVFGITFFEHNSKDFEFKNEIFENEIK